MRFPKAWFATQILLRDNHGRIVSHLGCPLKDNGPQTHVALRTVLRMPRDLEIVGTMALILPRDSKSRSVNVTLGESCLLCPFVRFWEKLIENPLIIFHYSDFIFNIVY